MNNKHSIYYKYGAKECARLHYGLAILNCLVFGGGAIVALWLFVFRESWIYLIFSLFCFFLYFILSSVLLNVLGGVLYIGCDAVKMKDICYIIENKVAEKGKIIWRMFRAQAASFVPGGEQESFELLQTCKNYKKSVGYEIFYLSLYIRHYARTQEWESYQEIKEKLYNMIMAQTLSSKKRQVYERYMNEIEAGEKYRAGEIDEARNLYQKLLDEKKSNMLNKVLIHKQLFELDMKEGKQESAKQHLIFVAQNGGTTYMAEEAKAKLQELE